MANLNQEIKYTKLFINNEFVESVTKKTFVTSNPANGKKLADVAEGDKDDVNLAVEAAKKAFKESSEWRNMDQSARARLMHKLADLIDRDSDIIANVSLWIMENLLKWRNSMFILFNVASLLCWLCRQNSR
ncbi:hypothetical protein PVAND_004123 [Polypedilum vanderplanki]|uniref:Aldehyde dehydrogenase domain-containing protein n=1 Tax=Polypedilum vanderplanki TaxID=319348 RepID=A0A9J6BWM8_POLVA|nr:hypothetical protein PVAND_004123 [Polypedilum vanderplanki]